LRAQLGDLVQLLAAQGLDGIEIAEPVFEVGGDIRNRDGITELSGYMCAGGSRRPSWQRWLPVE
jgi:hypothetical protein